jgi:hypothetical protein
MVMNLVGLRTKNRCAGEGLAAIQQQTVNVVILFSCVQPHPYVYGRVILIVTTVLTIIIIIILLLLLLLLLLLSRAGVKRDE